MNQFFQRLWETQKQKKTYLCVGLDPNRAFFPRCLGEGDDVPFRFLKEIVDHTLPYTACYKPQIAYFSAFGWEAVLDKIIQYIKQKSPETQVILDSKRNDIGSTADMYAREAFERYQADAVTFNPYMGGDTVEPFSRHQDKAVFVLCRTSNPGAKEFQNLVVGDGEPLYQFVANRAVQHWNKNDNIGLVVGATAVKELRKIRQQCPEVWFLVPGVGAQGGDLAAVIEYGRRVDTQGGLIINSARAILYASDDKDFAVKAGEVAAQMQQQMEQYFQ